MCESVSVYRGESVRERESEREEGDVTYLKSMQQPKPMPHLMHRRLPQIITFYGKRRLRHTARQHVAPVGRVVLHLILNRPIRSLIGYRRRQRTVAQQCGRGTVGVGCGGEVGLEINV